MTEPEKGWMNKFSGPNAAIALAMSMIVFVVTLAMGVAGTAAMKAWVQPKLCSTCHNALTVSKGLAMSSHSEFQCTDCHRKSGTSLFESRKVAEVAARKVASQQAVPKEVCLKCHSANRKVSPSGDIRIPHQKHLDRGLQCVNCHIGVAHGQKTDKRGAGIIKFTGPSMATCIDCHSTRNVSTSCGTCHTSDRKPESHKNPTWGTRHGVEARKDTGVCGMCHLFTKEKAVKIAPGAPVTEFARANPFCSSCHVKRPITHTPTWPVEHKQYAKSDRARCLVCHNEEPPKDGEKVSPVFCYKCHRDLHPDNWKKLHPTVVKNVGVVDGKCFSCHVSTQCAKCHAANKVGVGNKPAPEQR